MTHRIKSVKTCDDLKILVVFWNGIEKSYDIKGLYSIFPQFKALESDGDLFHRVCIDPGGYGISWNDDLDLDSEEIWDNGRLCNE